MENRTGIFDHPEPQLPDFLTVGRALLSAVPAPVIVGAIRIVPAVRFIMLAVIGIKII